MESNLLVFFCDEGHYALPVTSVERVIRIVEVTPLPESPAILAGVFDLQGEMTPVVSLRRLLGLPEKEVALEDVLIILWMGDKPLALMADGAEGVFAFAAETSADADTLFPELTLLGVVRWHEKLLPVIDIETLVSHEINALHHWGASVYETV